MNRRFEYAGDFHEGLAKINTVETVDKYENIWKEDKAEQLYKIYDNPKALFEFENIDKKFFKTALSVIKQKLVDMGKKFSKEEVAEYKAQLNEEIKVQFGDLVEELRQDKIYSKMEEIQER